MKKFIMKKEQIPTNRIYDCRRLQNFIQEKLDIKISLVDVYELWDKVSESCSAGWLYYDTCPYGQTREEFLMEQMEKFGYIVEEGE